MQTKREEELLEELEELKATLDRLSEFYATAAIDSRRFHWVRENWHWVIEEPLGDYCDDPVAFTKMIDDYAEMDWW